MATNLQMTTNYKLPDSAKLQMTTNRKTVVSNQENKILHKDLSYKIVGILMEVHKKLGCFAREKQYCDLFANL